MKLTDLEKKNLERAKFWETTWNNDPMRMVDECYAKDCKVYDMLGGYVCNGREELRKLEQSIMKADPTRRIDSYATMVSGNRVALEADMSWKNGTVSVKACVFLTFNEDGFVIEDHSYSKNVEDLDFE